MSRNTMQLNYRTPRYKHSAPRPQRRRTRAGVTVAAVTLSLVAAAPGIATSAERYDVQAGDTLASIAEKFGYTGDNGWRRLYDANKKVDNPDLIVVGETLTVPDRKDRVKRRKLPQTQTQTQTQAPRRESSGASRSVVRTPAPAAPAASVWTQLAGCESGGNWASNTGNGYYGGLQFSLSSWQAVGGTGYPHEASAATQIAMGQRLQAAQGWGAWPGCAAELGLL